MAEVMIAFVQVPSPHALHLSIYIKFYADHRSSDKLYRRVVFRLPDPMCNPSYELPLRTGITTCPDVAVMVTVHVRSTEMVEV